MKKTLLKAGPALAAVVLSVATMGAGMASVLGWHQPKVPESLMKD